SGRIRGRADPPAVELTLAGPVAVADGQLEQVHALQEERPLLRIEQLARPEGDLRWIGLDLTEVRVDRRRQRERRSEPVLEIEPRVPAPVVGLVERIASGHPRPPEARRGVRQELEVGAPAEVRDAVEDAELADDLRRT